MLIPHAEITVKGQKILTNQDLNFNDTGEESQWVPMRGAVALEKVVKTGYQPCEFTFDYEIPDEDPIPFRAYHDSDEILEVRWLGAEGIYVAKCVVGNPTETDPRAGGHKMQITLRGWRRLARSS